jgi:hypothetical protein
MLVQMVPVHGVAVGGKDVGCEATGELAMDGAVASPVDEVVTEVKGSPIFELELNELVLVLLPTKLELAELALASLSDDKDDKTLRTELVSLKVPVVIVGVVPARVIVNEVVRPRAPLSAVLTAVEVLIAGVTEDKELVDVDVMPDDT